mgnify:CR=1 FL=1
MIEHEFTGVIREVLESHLGPVAEEAFERSDLLQYINLKSRSASRGSKSRGSFANHYALYVLIEDYLAGDFDGPNDYAKYDGARFTDLFHRQRELPFGERLQNHALNSRLNEEFRKYFPTSEFVPILRDLATSRYWINEQLLRVTTSQGEVNIATAVISIIDAYIESKRDSFSAFIEQCERLQALGQDDVAEVIEFLLRLLDPNVDARIFEIVSFSILKSFYAEQSVWFGWTIDEVSEHALILFKTGRTNANDGGIDFVMQPVGRFFQVTESLDMRRYFLDIDKVQRFPITFVVKSEESAEQIRARLADYARKIYTAGAIVARSMEAVEEVINIPDLRARLEEVAATGNAATVVNEVALQAKVEFNFGDEDSADDPLEESAPGIDH